MAFDLIRDIFKNIGWISASPSLAGIKPMDGNGSVQKMESYLNFWPY
jgi:hypothetical protein